jgi:hypothetical protein
VAVILSVAVNVVIETVNEDEAEGIAKAVTAGGFRVVGVLAELPGKLPASISAILLKVSVAEASEFVASIARNAAALRPAFR